MVNACCESWITCCLYFWLRMHVTLAEGNCLSLKAASNCFATLSIMLVILFAWLGITSSVYGLSVFEINKRQGLIPFPRVGRALSTDGSLMLSSEEMKDAFYHDLFRSSRLKREVELELNDDWNEINDDSFQEPPQDEKKMVQKTNKLAPRLGRSGFRVAAFQPRLGRGYQQFSPRLGRGNLSPRLGKRMN